MLNGIFFWIKWFVKNGKLKKRYLNFIFFLVIYDIIVISILYMVFKKLYKMIDLKYIGFIYKL